MSSNFQRGALSQAERVREELLRGLFGVGAEEPKAPNQPRR
jgi:hypothetical protein